MRAATLCAVGFATMCFGAKGDGCAVEVQPGDGSSESWDLGKIPEKSGPDLPMTCEWLDGDNCWKDIAKEAQSCLEDSQGTFDEERTACTFEDGSSIELEGPISKPADNLTLLPVVNHRILRPDGSACHTAKVLGAGRTAHANRAGTAVFESLSLTAYRVTCPNGDSYSNTAEGSCETFGLRWLGKDAPGYTLYCYGETDSCEATLWNATEAGPATLFSCTDP